MRFLLDTNAVSEVVKPKPNAGYMEWLASVDQNELGISCLVIGEGWQGITLATEKAQKKRLQDFWQAVTESYAGRIIPITTETCQLWGTLTAKAKSNGYVKATVDALLAAQALEQGLTLVTRNTRDFTPFKGVNVLCPWT